MPRPLRFAAAGVVLYFLYFHGLTSVGLIGPDEPRYASVARDMALTGDWITPRLWGDAWFEKPALEYWGQALAFKLGLGDDLSPRLFNAICAAVFVWFFYRTLAREFSPQVARSSTTILATSIAWIAEARIAVMDMPLAASFSAAMLFALRGNLAMCGVLLGVAMLAKGLVGLALALPLVWWLRHEWRKFPAALMGLAIVAAPWYAAVTLRHGAVFLNEFFVKHHFSRFAEGALQHVQPWWFFVPVLLAGLFPWTPLVALLRRPADRREEFLWMWLLWGLLFFSASRNKLPGYALPLIPPLAVLLGIAISRAAQPKAWAAACGALLCLTPVAAAVLPEALAGGLSRATFAWPLLAMLAVGAAGVVAGLWKRELAVAGVTALCVTLLGMQVFPVLDERASARGMWLQIARQRERVCIEQLHRSWRYGLNYYLGRPVPECIYEPRPVRLFQRDTEQPLLMFGPKLD